MRWLKHAFAVEPPGPVEPDDEQKAIVERVCREIVRRHLTTPAIVFLESSRPLNYLGSQALHFFTPIVSVLGNAAPYQHFANFLARRGSVDYLCERIQELESQCQDQGPSPDQTETALPK